MGIYDSVIFDCPNCGAEIEEQTKDGDPSMATYEYTVVPIALAAGMIGRACWCHHCDKTFTITGPELPRTIALTLVEFEEDDDQDSPREDD